MDRLKAEKLTARSGGEKRIGITFSTFDLLHAGHIMMLAEAKRQCDYLIAGLQTDPTIDRPEKNSPVQTVVERYIKLKGCRYVDEVVCYASERDLEDILRAFQIHVRIVGDEYRDKNFTGREYCEQSGIELYFNRRDHRFSSSGLRKIVAECERLRVAKTDMARAEAEPDSCIDDLVKVV